MNDNFLITIVVILAIVGVGQHFEQEIRCFLGNERACASMKVNP